MDRRHLLKLLSALCAVGYFRPAFALEAVTGHFETSNFKDVYKDPGLRNSFLSFLENVYSIYDPDKFHKIIADVTEKNDSDEEIYKALQKRLPEVKTLLLPFTRQLPALGHQKDEMSGQVAELMGKETKPDGYMEIGTSGRYVHGVQKAAHTKGKVYLLHTDRPQFFSLTDIVERGQLSRIGKFVDLANYRDIKTGDVPDGSLDLITNFIGFHHAPVERRDGFIKSVVSKLSPGGKLIVRDHDVDGEKMRLIVALAHDVFNAGLNQPWETNAAETRNFTSLDQLEEALAKAGMKRTGDKLRQKGDPTRNTLMLFERA